jgi:hypothetical protein
MDMLMIRLPDGAVDYIDAASAPGAEVGGPLPSEELLAAEPINAEVVTAALANPAPSPQAAPPSVSTSPYGDLLADEQGEDKSYLDSLSDTLQYLDLTQLLSGAARPKFDPPGILRPRGGGGTRALQRLGIASLS